MRRSWLIPAIAALVVGGPAALAPAQQKPSITEIGGVLVDHACYMAMKPVLVSDPELTRCSLAGARKGHRLAVISAAGSVWLVKGVLTENNNSKLLPLVSRPVLLSGTITEQDLTAANAIVEPETDTRRSPLRDGEVSENHVRKGDFREGDQRSGVVMIIDATSAIDLLTKTRIQ